MNNFDSYIHKVEWDSSFFGFPVAELDDAIPISYLKKTINHSRTLRFKLLYLRIKNWSNDSHEKIVECDGILVDTKVTYQKEVLSIPGQKNLFIEDINDTTCINQQFLDIVIQTGKFSRFNTDKNFGRDNYESLYTLWITRSVSGELADKVLVHTNKNLINGYITLKVKSKTGQIILIGVDESQRGKGIGYQLLLSAEQYFRERGCATLSVVTQEDNIEACRFYERFGFTLLKKEFIYHIWIK